MEGFNWNITKIKTKTRKRT